MAGDSDVGEEGTEDTFNFDEWANNIDLKRPATLILRNEELTSKEMLIFLEQKDMKELGLTMGTIKLIQKQIAQWKDVKDTGPVLQKMLTLSLRITQRFLMGQVRCLTFYSAICCPLLETENLNCLGKWTHVLF